MSNELTHHGILGMKWGVRKDKYGSKATIKKGSAFTRISSKDQEEHKGYAYVSFDKNIRDIITPYEKAQRLFNSGTKITYKAAEDLVLPSTKTKVEEFVKIMDSDPEFLKEVAKTKRNLMLFIPVTAKRYEKKYYNLASKDSKTQEEAYEAFAWSLGFNKKTRNKFVSALQAKGYNAMLDDADIKLGSVSKGNSAPVIVFDRKQSLILEQIQSLKR